MATLSEPSLDSEQVKADRPECKATKVRGRPRAFDRTCALDNAMRLFWSKGYEATSMTDLTTAMGIGSPSLYAAFGSKEALYAEALDRYVETSAPFARDKFAVAPTVREAVSTLLFSLASALTGRSCDAPTGCMMTLSAVGSEGHVALGKRVRAGRAVTRGLVEERLARAIGEGEVSAMVDVHAIGRFVQAVQMGMAIMARDGASRDALESVAEIAMAGLDVRMSAPDLRA